MTGLFVTTTRTRCGMAGDDRVHAARVSEAGDKRELERINGHAEELNKETFDGPEFQADR